MSASNPKTLWQRLRQVLSRIEARPASGVVPRGVSRINLALQGGGSHGAFTWGVLDRLLGDDTLEIGAISGTSAGAMNAAVLASGYAADGRAGARAALAAFWHDVAEAGSAFAPFSLGNGGAAPAFDLHGLPGWRWVHSWFRSFSPYEFNPLNLNPLRDVLQRHVDVQALRRGPIGLFITATAVHTGQARIFTGRELSHDALLASACLPFLFQAVEIDGEPYWDGGYAGNPALYPLIDDTPDLDIVLVRINPLARRETPRRTMDIVDRVNEITFNGSLLAEMRAIDFVDRLLREHRVDAGRYKALRMHMIADDDALLPHGASSKLNTELAFLTTLFEQGRAAADRFLERHRADIGRRSTLDLRQGFLGEALHRRR